MAGAGGTWRTGEPVWFSPPGAAVPLPGEVLEVHQAARVLLVQAQINGKPQTFALQMGGGASAGAGSVVDGEEGDEPESEQVRPREELGPTGVEDMTRLHDLHEAALLWNLKLRYDAGLIYTYAGSILVALNPYRSVDALYGLDTARRYAAAAALGDLPPHLFALAAAARAALPEPQALLISGESGAGKTESTKLAVQFLAAIAPAPPGRAPVSEQILEAAPLLEAFGNARTPRNTNSSRFGKLLELYFRDGALAGARVAHYLLEKSRIVTHSQGERNYHVFYELLAGLDEEQRRSRGLLQAEDYFYLNQGGDTGGAGAGADWASLCGAMQVLGIGDAEREDIVRVLAAVLHLGNVYFHRRQLRHGQEGVQLGGGGEVRWAAHLLKVPAEDLGRALTTRVTSARAERMRSPLPIDQALDARDAFAKALYASLFNWLVLRINSIVHRSGLHDAQRISVLDIFGFEDLEENSFEQLCINYANESLQLYFNKHIFKLEQQEYLKEKLEWTNLTWMDNSPVIHLLSKKPVGILHLLDDESNFPRASDASFLEKCHYNHALNELYSRPRVGAKEFGIKHYAGQVWYNVEGFLEKNRDSLRPDVVELLCSSGVALVADMSAQLRAQHDANKTLPRGANGRFVTMKPRTPTVAARFSDSLQQLLDWMSKCHPWFVRCIKPNHDKSPMRLDMPCVLAQLRYTGMLDTIKIRQTGYPTRIPFQTFVERYRYLLSSKPARGTPHREVCNTILASIPPTGTEGADYQLGAARVFLREAVHRHLERARADTLQRAATLLQAHARAYLARKHYQSLRHGAVHIQAWWRGKIARRKYLKIRRGVIRTQALVRGRRARSRYAARREQHRRLLEVQQANAKRRSAERQASGLQALEVPAELAFIFSKLDDWRPPHNERNLVKVVGDVWQQEERIQLPRDLQQFAFAKFSSVYFADGGQLSPRRHPISRPFLSKAAVRDQDFTDAIAVFKLILRWCEESSSSANASSSSNERRQKALADYIAHKGLAARGLRDEILVQLCNQLHGDVDPAALERVCQLMAYCLSAFQPGPALYKYLLRLVSSLPQPRYRGVLIRRLAGIAGSAARQGGVARRCPPTQLEWRALRANTPTATALPLHLPDGVVRHVAVESWTSCERAASCALAAAGYIHAATGWTLTLEHNGQLTESCGADYVLDLIGELELCPAFPSARGEPLRPGRVSTSRPLTLAPAPPPARSPPLSEQATPHPKRPQVPPPEPPSRSPLTSLKPTPPAPPAPANRPQRDSVAPLQEFTWQRPEHPTKPKLSDEYGNSRKVSHDILSRESALNERYFDQSSSEKMRSRSLDNLLGSEPTAPSPTNLADLGLSQSKLNERYHSVEQLGPPSTMGSKRREHVELDYGMPPPGRGQPPSRYIKSQYAGKRAPAGSQSSSRAYIEKSSEFGGVRSSAMSDTSEAPSLASHVRRVRVPSQASDVDQFLDELFSPVLDSNLDELSDARSLAASIKGDNTVGRSFENFIDSTMKCDSDEDNFDFLNDAHHLNRLLKGGGTKEIEVTYESSTTENGRHLNGTRRTNSGAGSVDDYITDLFDPIFVNDSLKRLTDKDELAGAIKGGGTTHQSTAAGSSSFSFGPMSPGLMSSPIVIPGSAGADNFASLGYTMPVSPSNNPEVAAYQQNLQRAFLQSAMAQNIQIQQQLLAQNQALQTLLTQQVTDVAKSPPTESHSTVVRAQVHNPPHRKASFNMSNGSFVKDLKSRKVSSDSNTTSSSRGAGAPPPPPPPMPPPIEMTDPSEARPFLDPYGRAKTVRIGKWRWPPPQGAIDENGEDFMHFKMRQIQRKHTPSSQQNIRDSSHSNKASSGNTSPGIDWDEFEVEHEIVSSPKREASGQKPATRRSFEIGAQRPSPGSVGKLKLSSEMRQRLEQVTANHSVRSTSSNNETPRTINKLEDARKMMLERQLGGSHWDVADSPGDSSGVRAQVQRMDAGRRPAPPPLPPAPPGPAPPPPSHPPPPPQPPDRAAPPPPQPEASSFMQLRQDRDTFGVHQNQEGFETSDDRHAFLANWKSRGVDAGHRFSREDMAHKDDNLATRFMESDRRLRDRRDHYGPNDGWDGESGSDMKMHRFDNRDFGNSNKIRNVSLGSKNDWDKESANEVQMKHRDSYATSQEDSDRYEIQAIRLSPRWDDNGSSMNERYEQRDQRKQSSYSGASSFRDDEFSNMRYRDNFEGRKNSREMLMGKSFDSPRIDNSRTSSEQRDMGKEHERPTFKTHMAQKERDRKLEAERRHSVSTHATDKTERLERDSPVPPSLLPPDTRDSAFLTYNRVPWRLRVRKELFSPLDSWNDPSTMDLLYAQIVADVTNEAPSLRVSPAEKRSALTLLRTNGVQVLSESLPAPTPAPPTRAHVKRQLVELARSWPFYFARLFAVRGGGMGGDEAGGSVVAVGHGGVAVGARAGASLAVRARLQLTGLRASAPAPGTLVLSPSDAPPLTLHTPLAMHAHALIVEFVLQQSQVQPKSPATSNGVRGSSLERTTETSGPSPTPRSPAPRSPSPPVHPTSASHPPNAKDGRHPLLQFALDHFRESPELEVLKGEGTNGAASAAAAKARRNEWTWKRQTDVVKWQAGPLRAPLLRLEPHLAPLALDTFDATRAYCGDHHHPDLTEVKCVYTILMHCHAHPALRDEVYCQLMKQSTSNRSPTPDSAQRAWRLLSVVAAYFTCSDALRPFLMDYLSSAASDRRRGCQGTAAVCLANLRKTMRCGGRKNVPSVEEVTAVSAGRSARRQLYRLPGGAERVVNTRCATVVADVVRELCDLIGVRSESERAEFSLYCIVAGDALTMPLAGDEYVLDVTTELQRAHHPFYLIFCRSVWHHPLRSDAPPLYTEVLFNQVAPDYLEGLLLVLPGGGAPGAGVLRDVASVAALLHRAAGLPAAPHTRELKFLLPKPLLGMREPRPQKWSSWVTAEWGSLRTLTPGEAKARVLAVLSRWSLFGSSFFAVRLASTAPPLSAPPAPTADHVLALNRRGVHLLDTHTHETVTHWPYAEVISTRKVRSDDGTLFLDLKCGSLLQQRVTRLQAEQAHEVSRLVRQYIALQRDEHAAAPLSHSHHDTHHHENGNGQM